MKSSRTEIWSSAPTRSTSLLVTLVCFCLVPLATCSRASTGANAALYPYQTLDVCKEKNRAKESFLPLGRGVICSIRGGQSDPGRYYSSYDRDLDDRNNGIDNRSNDVNTGYYGSPPNAQYAQSDTNAANSNLPPSAPTPPLTTAHSTVPANDGSDPYYDVIPDDRFGVWRSAQQQMKESRTKEQEDDDRDETGKVKLFTTSTISKGARAFIFFVMTWRDMHFYEVADHVLKGKLRTMAVIPVIFLFVANMAGSIANCVSTGHSTKKRMKALLNLNKLLEALLIIWYIIRLTIAPSKYVPREMFFSCIIHSLFFIVQCQAYTRVTWDDVPESTATAAAAAGFDSNIPYYDDNYSNQDGYTNEWEQPASPYDDQQYTSQGQY